MESELETLKSSTSSSSSEITTLKTRVQSLESSNRDTLSLLETKSTSYDKLAEDLTAQHQKTLDLRKECSALEQKVQSAEAASLTAKYHEENLRQEIEHLKRNNDWLDRELKTKSEEYSKYRKDKSARIIELQRQNDEASNTIDVGRRTEQNLRHRLEEFNQKVEDCLLRIQHLEEEATRAEESHRINLDSTNRLVELTRNSANTEKQRQQDLQAELESTKENAQEAIARLGAELETEHRERERAELRVEELETQIEQLETKITQLGEQGGSASLHGGVNGHPSTPGRESSPLSRLFSPTPSRLKGGLSMTQLYSQYNELKSELAATKQENERLSASVDEMLQDAESMRPEIEEVRAERDQLESNVAEMSSMVDSIGKERDQALKSARKTNGQIEAKAREGEVLRKQLRDLSLQIKVLLFELDRRTKGLNEFTSAQQEQLEHLARGGQDSDDPGETDTDRFISAELVIYKDIAQLQAQNTKLLKLTRELGEQMEREEAQRKESQAAQDPKDYKQLYERCQDEVKSLLTQSQSYIRERDMFRRMLTHRGQLPRDGNLDLTFGESNLGVGGPATPSQSRVLNSIEQSPISKDMSDYAKLLKDMQLHFDTYRQEAATDHKTLRDQVDKLSITNGELRSEVSRSNSQVTLAHERYQMLQANYAMLKSENNELQKRSQFYSDNAAKQDLRTQQVAEDLVETKGLLDSMRNENANLKVERDFFKTIEKRLTADNDVHFSERTRLNNLNASLQNLLNEREQSDGETRRKLQTQVENLEEELRKTKKELSDQVEEHKRTSDRREYEHQQSQKRIDDLISSLGSVREDLVAAKTTRDHLQARVDELSVELRSAEERVRLLQPIPARNLAADAGEEISDPATVRESPLLNREQELTIEISELKRDLELTKPELDNWKAQVDQYKAISQSSEEELQNLNETQELYRQEMDRIVEEKSARIQELEHRINDTSSELASTNTELTQLRTKEVESDRRLEEQKSSFEAELTQLKDQADRHAIAAKYHQEDLTAQAEIAQQAQQNYENELVKHAEAAKALQKVRSEFNDLKVEIVEIKTEAETARTRLGQSEESWSESKQRYEAELMEMREGRQNLIDQNNRLHQQLESLSKQITSLHKKPTSSKGDESVETATSTGLENLQEVIKYLRREKEIVDVQLELSSQEAKRLKQLLDHTQSQLDDTRVKLNQQRRLEENSERSSLNHSKLMDTINELNTFRESNVTLRNEFRHAQASLAQKTGEVEQLLAQVEPLRSEILQLKIEQETQVGETRLLQEDRDRWRQRTQDILQKYDRVDPAELEALKTQLQNLQTERDELVSSKQSLEDQLSGKDGQITQAQEEGKTKYEEMRSRLTDQFKTRSKNLSDKIREKDGSLQIMTKEKLDLEQQLVDLQQELETAKGEKDQAINDAANSHADGANGVAHNGSEDGQVDEDEPRPSQADVQSLQERLNAAESRASEEAARSSSFQGELTTSQARISELENRILKVQQDLQTANADLERSQAQSLQQSVETASNITLENEVNRLRQGLAQAQQDNDNLRMTASLEAGSTGTAEAEGGKSIANQLVEMRAEIEAELEVRHNERVRKAEETFEKRTQNMKAQLSKKLADGKDQIRQSLVAEKEQALQELRTAHTNELEDLKRRHQEELDELRRNEESRFSQFKSSWVAEPPPKESDTEPAVKRESQIPGPSWQPTDEEARAFVASNATVKSIMQRNIVQKINDAKAALTAQLKDEHAKESVQRLEDAQRKANAAKEQAVLMEGKRTSLKLNMTENRAKLAQLKLDIVQKAAEETPQKPVEEVWVIAKGAKPPAQQQQVRSPANIHNQASISGQATPVQQAKNASPLAQAPPRGGMFGQPTPISQAEKPQVQGETAQDPSDQVPPQQAVPQTQNPFQSNARSQPPKGPSQPNSGQQLSQGPATIQLPSSLPIKQGQGNHPGTGTGPATLRGLQQSGLPVARGGPGRGGRALGQSQGQGRGQGRGRGGPQTVNTNPMQVQQPATSSPTQLSGAAKQFVPQGNKRPREDGEGGQQGGESGNGKRIRGGAGGT